MQGQALRRTCTAVWYHFVGEGRQDPHQNCTRRQNGARTSPFPAPNDFQLFRGYYYLTANFSCSLEQNLTCMNMVLHGETAKQNGGFALRCCSLLIIQPQKSLVSVPSFPAPAEILWYVEICVDARRRIHAFVSWALNSVFKWQIPLCLQYAWMSYIHPVGCAATAPGEPPGAASRG